MGRKLRALLTVYCMNVLTIKPPNNFRCNFILNKQNILPKIYRFYLLYSTLFPSYILQWKRKKNSEKLFGGIHNAYDRTKESVVRMKRTFLCVLQLSTKRLILCEFRYEYVCVCVSYTNSNAYFSFISCVASHFYYFITGTIASAQNDTTAIMKDVDKWRGEMLELLHLFNSQT